MVKAKMNDETQIKLQLTEMHNKLKINRNTSYIRNDYVKKERKTPKIPSNTLFPREMIKMRQRHNNKCQFKNTFLKNANIFTRTVLATYEI